MSQNLNETFLQQKERKKERKIAARPSSLVQKRKIYLK
jgi:hypothetical protein